VSKMKHLILGVWLAYIGTILAANYLISHVGTHCIPDGPCLIPVFPGLDAPSGVLMIGIALVLRDIIHDIYGRWWVLGGIAVGAALSATLSPSLALASGVAFGISELADMGVYEPLRKYSRPLSVALSGTVGAVVDSALFLYIAFGSFDHITGQIVGKTEMAVLGALVIIICRSIKKRDLSFR